MTTNQQLEMIARLTGGEVVNLNIGISGIRLPSGMVLNCVPQGQVCALEGDMLAVLERVCRKNDCYLTIDHDRHEHGLNWFVTLSLRSQKNNTGCGETFMAASLAALEQLDEELNDDR